MTLLNKKPWKLNFEVAEDVVEQETQFLWQPYIPFGAVTLIAGKGGVGKSTIACNIAARLSNGEPLPGQKVPYTPMKVLIISAEDDYHFKIVPKLRKFSANLGNIAVSNDAFRLDEEHIDGVEEAMKRFEATVVFFDPLVSYLGGGVDMNRSNETREFMNRLNHIAKNQNTAVIVIAHSRKNVNKTPSIDDVMGSADFTNAVRSGVLVYKKGGYNFFLHDKANWSEPGPTLGFTFENGITWTNAPEMVRVSTKPKSDGAKQFLIDTLVQGPLPQREMIRRATGLGFSEATITRVRQELKIKSTKVGSEWIWSLTEQEGLDQTEALLQRMKREDDSHDQATALTPAQ